MIPTAEEFCMKWQNSNHPSMIAKLLIEFAKLHVKAACLEAHKLSGMKWHAGESGYLAREDIELIYPLTNIK